MQQLLCTRKLLGDSNRKKFSSFYLYYSSERQIIIKCKSKMLLFSLSIMFNSFWPRGLQHAKLLCPIPSLGACSNSYPSGQWCHPTISPLTFPSPPAFHPSEHQSFFWRVGSSLQVAKLLELQLQHQSFQWIFRTDFL